MDKVDAKLDIISTGEREAWTGPKHAKKPLADLRDRLGLHARDTLAEFADLKVEDPYERGRVAQPKDYEKALDNADFGLSHLLRDAGPYIENGDFKEGLKATQAGIENRHIVREEVPQDQLGENITRLDTVAEESRGVMIFPYDFARLPDELQLWELLRRNMELILRQRGTSMVPAMMTDIYDMAFAYARTLRLGVKDKGSEKATVEVSADVIEDWAIEKLKLAHRI